MKKIASVLCMALLAVSFMASCTKAEDQQVAVVSLKLDKMAHTLVAAGETVILVANVQPTDAFNPNVTWASDNPAVAIVSYGGVADAVNAAAELAGFGDSRRFAVVAAVSSGVANIVATSEEGGYVAQCTITVDIPVPAESVSINTVEIKEETVTDEETGRTEVIRTEIFTPATDFNMFVGADTTLVAVVLPENARDKNVTWRSNNEAFVTVDNGMLRAVERAVETGIGVATITVSTVDGNHTASIQVTTEHKIIPVKYVILPETLTISAGASATLTPTFDPENASNQKVTWSSDKPEIASVVDGVVTGVSEGEAIITVTSEDGGRTDQCVVTVTPSVEDPDLAILCGATWSWSSNDPVWGDGGFLVQTSPEWWPVNAADVETQVPGDGLGATMKFAANGDYTKTLSDGSVKTGTYVLDMTPTAHADNGGPWAVGKLHLTGETVLGGYYPYPQSSHYGLIYSYYVLTLSDTEILLCFAPEGTGPWADGMFCKYAPVK